MKIGKLRINKKTSLGILILFVVGFGVWYVNQANAKRLELSSNKSSNPVIAQTSINSEYTFNALTANEKKTDIVLRITDAEMRKEVLIQGKPATASGDKAFLILNLEFDNEDTFIKYVMPIDLFRLLDDQGKKYASDIHSNMVDVSPISTKKTKIGFVVNQNQRQFNLQIGELEGEKTDIYIDFK